MLWLCSDQASFAPGITVSVDGGWSQHEMRAQTTKRLPGEEGIWVFICGDLMVFSIFFIVLLFYRSQNLPVFAQSQQTLSQSFGVLNTLLLLTSSLFVALAVRALRCEPAPNRELATRLVGAAIACGAGFVVVKGFEWSAKISAGHTLSSNDFYMFYFMYTGIHLLHVLVGLLVLSLVLMVTRRPQLEPAAVRMVEAGGVFWHLVDLLWVFLFALFYLLK
ncbi:MAG TPA: cytochrome c oxidase subunit 3 [Steroidobacteraceae bacterium]|nr:cytochrome c oxidase subunit 3 [Steroidobacteraceae bacterium]